MPSARRFALPHAPGALIGRDRELAAARDLLLSRKTRLLTLVGPPGVGKTRLALGVAAACQAAFRQGALFVDLAPLRTAELVLETIAKSLGLRQQGRLGPVDQLQAHLQDASVLLVLDNLEHLLDASVDLAGLLTHAPELAILATSRTSMQLRWEQVYSVSPLNREAAIDLFVERAQASRADFLCGQAELAAIDQICRALDGLPLAIELAAARCVILSPQELLARLGRRFDVLGDAPRDASARHQTLQGAIDWSYNLLSEPERRLFRRLAVFAGSFSVDAAEAVADSDASTLELLASLVRKSLVRFAPAVADDESRFRLLETVRAFAWERLASAGETTDAQQRHAQFLCAFVVQHYALNFGPDQPAWFARLERDHADLRQALHWALETGHTELAQRLAAALHWFWYGGGYLAEGTDFLARALVVGNASPIAARAAALRALGALVLNQGDYARAIGCLEEAVAVGQSRPPDHGSQAELAMALGILGVAQIASGRYDAAEQSISNSLATFEVLGDEWGIATAREVLGAIAALRGQADVAERLASEALTVHRRLGGRENIARALDVLGYAAALRGELATANACFDESLALRRAAPNRPATAAVLAKLGLVAYLGQQWDRAATLYRESLALAHEVGDAAGVVRCLGQIAALALACGLDRRAIARLGNAVRQHQAELGLPSPPVEQIAARRLAAALRAEISPLGLAAAWLGSRGMDLDHTARLGLELLDELARTTHASSANGAAEHLTPRETQVAALIAHGLTNRQIAEELVIAQRTVDTHVERILAKLNFAARAQVAVWAASHGLLEAKNT